MIIFSYLGTVSQNLSIDFPKTETDSYSWKGNDSYSAEFFITLDSEQEVITRSVYNAFDLLAKVGGFYEILDLIALLITWKFKENEYVLSLISSIYHRKEGKSKTNHQKYWQEITRNESVLRNLEEFEISEKKNAFKIQNF